MKNILTPLGYLSIGFAMVLIILTMVAFFVFPEPWGGFICIGLVSVFYLYLIAYILRSINLRLKRRKIAGELILVVKSPQVLRILYSFLIVMYLFNSSVSLYSILKYSQPASSLQIANLFFVPILILFWGTLIFRKMEIREHGVYVSPDFLPWEAIESYAWVGSSAKTLLLRLKKPKLLNKGYLWEVDEKYGEAANQVMLQRVYYRGNADAAGEGIRL